MYIIKEKTRIVEIKGTSIEYKEKLKVDPKTGENIFDRKIEDENFKKAFDIYKKEKGLLTSDEIVKIRKKYNLTQKDFAKILGLGEVTINRYERGTIQTSVNDEIIRVVESPYVMLSVIERNSENVSVEVYNELYIKVNRLIELSKHKKIKEDLSKLSNLNFETANVLDIAKVLLIKAKKLSNDLTQIDLNKLSYYINGVSLAIFDSPAYQEKTLNWKYGPVVEELYQEYSFYKGNIIPVPSNELKLSEGLEKVIELVISSYGKYKPWSLVELTHNEDPWRNTKQNQIITTELIKRYFKEVYES